MKEDLNIEYICYANHQLLIKIDDLLKDLNDSKNENQRLTDLIEIRDDANIDLVEEIKELEQTIFELQNDYNNVVDTNESFIKRMAKQAREINALYKENEQQKTEINRIAMICEVKDDVAMDMRNELLELEKENKNLRKNIEYLCDENIRLRHELNEVKNNDNHY